MSCCNMAWIALVEPAELEKDTYHGLGDLY
jgi:hypothetical protein